MKKKILAHVVSLIAGLCLAYYSSRFPILPGEVSVSKSALWSFFVKEYWWLMLIFFVVGYGLTFLVFYLFNRES